MRVKLIDKAFYWIKPRYADTPEWVVGRWESGCFWDPNGREATPDEIVGPIPTPDEETAS